MFLGVWAAGGLLVFAGAMAYAELAALRPRAGGMWLTPRLTSDGFGRLLYVARFRISMTMYSEPSLALAPLSSTSLASK